MGGNNVNGDKGSKKKGAICFIFGLVGGTGSSIITKILYTMQAEGVNGEVKPFAKPMFLTLVMFCEMAIALPVYTLMRLFTKDGEKKSSITLKVLGWLFIPALFDLVGSNFAQIGLVHTTVSMYQLLRCFVIVVTAILKRFALKHHLKSYMWFGVIIIIVAVAVASISSFIKQEDPSGASTSPHDPLVGFVFVIMSCIVQGSQYVFEEKILDEFDAHPLVVIGMEGLWGTIVMICISPLLYYLPGPDSGHIENIPEAFEMMKNSKHILIGVLVFFFTITTYNVFSIYVTAYLSAIWHAILDNFRPLSVWLVDLAIFYWITNGSFGESWTDTSWLQAFGMGILFMGTAVYNGSIMIPGCNYDEDFIEGPISPGMHVPEVLSSHYMGRSPIARKASLRTMEPNPYGSTSESQPLVVRPPLSKRSESSNPQRVNYSY